MILYLWSIWFSLPSCLIIILWNDYNLPNVNDRSIFIVPNEIVKQLPSRTFCNYGEPFIFNMEISNPSEEVHWRVNDSDLRSNHYVGRIKPTNFHNGTHQLVILKCQEDVTGTVDAITRTNVDENKLTSSSVLKIGLFLH